MRILVHIVLLALLIESTTDSFAQGMSGSLEQHIDSIIDNLPGSGGEDYVTPTTSQHQAWQAIVANILQKNLTTAEGLAVPLNYYIIEYLDVTSSQVFYILEEKTPHLYYWGTYVFNAAPCRTKLVIQSPHPKYDFNTGKEAVFCFQRLSALAYCLSGTHRCSSSQASPCSGTTSSCGSPSAPFRVSDMAHSTEGMYQITTSAILAQVPGAAFVQLHGFSKQPTDPYVILSNGTRETPTTDHIASLMIGLQIADPSLTFKAAHIDTTWTRLIGFTNVQGRMINNSADHCNTSAVTTTGNFIHIEQEKTKLRDDSTGWYKVYQALSAAFPCDTTVGIQEPSGADQNFRIYPTPVSSDLTIEGDGIDGIMIFNNLGKLIVELEGGKNRVIVDLADYCAGLYLLAVMNKQGTFVRTITKF